MARRIVCALACLVASSLSARAAQGALSVWISPAGSNSHGNGSRTSPWRTPQRALAHVASLRQGNNGRLPGPVTIGVFPGLFEMNETLALTPETSGDPGVPVSFQADDPGAPNVFSGASVLRNVEPGADGTFTFAVPDSVPCPGGCRQLFRVAYDPGNAPMGRRNLSRSETLTYLKLTTDDMLVPKGQLSAYSPASLAQSEAVLYHSWTASLTPVRAWDPSASTLTFRTKAVADCYSACQNKYYVQNIQDASLLRPGSFFVTTLASGSRTITYRPHAGESVRPGDFAIGNLSSVVSTSGPSAGAVSNVMFHGITFAHTASHLNVCMDNGCNAQSDSDTNNAAVQLANASNIVFFNCTFRHTGSFGLWVQDGSHDIDAKWVFFRHMGAGAVRVGRFDVHSLPRRVTVSDSTFLYTGEVLAAGPGVLVQQAADVTITHNRFMHTRYTAISAGWTWGYKPTQVSNISISYNDISGVFGGELSDGGCVYTLGIQPGTVVNNNRCWDVDSRGYGGWGYYTDEGSSFITFTNNLVHSTKSAGIHQHYGLNNVFRNNIIAFPGAWPCDGEPGCDNAGLRSSPSSSGPKSLSSFTFDRNIMLLNQNYSQPFYTTSPMALNNETFDNNVYWSTTKGADMLFGPSQRQGSFAEWQKLGNDVHSVVADPQFSDPEGFDFQLMPGSPALKLGFQPIDFSTNGPRNMR